ncbi:NADH dehydrogenase, alpha subcomplex, subunit 8 [Cystobasidium minutum MCA 4210]|uniref:NADH dehydrogenase, alpha subcomplex, subunit 8 n=1 Tax=Cystobasidium minutum MCA 4210 TaxID=1397322 RepID=UPI0034CE325A|eukprot:jgi/Rhomi1/159468/estExt_Genewise1Plus.C_3_t20218
MATYRDAKFPDVPYIDPAPLPKSVPQVDELGVTSAPLKSAAFFIGAHCKPYNEDFMLCKSENRDPEHCLKEGRRVTRCARDLINKLRENCAAEFDAHWNCLEKNNQELYLCRKVEKPLNKCVFEKMGLKKEIPGTPEGKAPIHEKKWPIYGHIQK